MGTEAVLETQKQVKRGDFREVPIFIGFFSWWIFVIPKEIIEISIKVMKKTFNFFSIDLLLKTLLLPWKRDEIDTTNMSLDDRVRVMVMNLVSRLVGAIVRGGAIIIGLGAMLSTLIACIVTLALFLGLPLIALYFIVASLNFTTY